jgi:hypothetical protein
MSEIIYLHSSSQSDLQKIRELFIEYAAGMRHARTAGVPRLVVGAEVT